MPRCYRKVIRITGHDSPNVRLALGQIAQGESPTGEIVVAGVLPYDDYKKRLATWDPVRIAVGIDAIFWQGPEIMLFPPGWLDRAERLADGLRQSGTIRYAKAIGIDPAEGGDKTSMSVVDEYGLIEQVSKRTPDTSIITSEALAFMIRHNVPPERVVFDRGGGGKEHADRLRSQGYHVRTVAFGESLVLDPKRGLRMLEEKVEQREEHYTYLNRRAQMYGELRLLIDPSTTGETSGLFSRHDKSHNWQGFAIPREYTELRRQLSPIPLTYDGEGRLYLLPKNKKNAEDKRSTLTQLLGCSPDEGDSLVLAIFGMLHRASRAVAGAIV